LGATVRTYGKHDRVAGQQVKRHLEWGELADGSDVCSEHNLSIGHDTRIGVHTVLGAAKAARNGIVAVSGGGELEIGVLTVNPSHEYKLISQESDVTIIICRPVIVLGGWRGTLVDRR
jgi:hypothetical protein